MEEATIIKRKRLKATGNIAWKVVRYEGEKYFSPWQDNILHRKEANITAKSWEADTFLETRIIGSGVFHAFTTRKIARIFLANAVDKEECAAQNIGYKIVKIVFDKKDFFCVGDSHPHNKKQWKIDSFPNDTVCITKFKFAER